MYERLYNLQDVMCVSSNNPVDWMVVWYYTVMMEDNYDKGSYIIKLPSSKHKALDDMIPPFEGPVVGFSNEVNNVTDYI